MPKKAPKGKPKHVQKPKARRVKDPAKKPLSKQELKFVACFGGNQIEAARLAGFKQPEKVASVIFNRPQVRAAIEAKQAAFVKKVGEREARGVTVTRNDIINRLDDLSQHAENDSTKVSALRELVDIFGLSSKYSDHDPFAGWTIEELEEFHRSGKWPARYAAPPDESAGTDADES
jgi:hypothetical protein